MQSSYKNFGALLILLGSVLFCALYNQAPLAGPVRGDTADKGSFEAITGESADEDKSVWDNFYRNKNNSFGKDPVSFLKDYIHMLPKGRAFVPAMGEGRNAIYLAKRGFTVDGNDVSDVAVEKAMAEAKQQKVTLKPIVADLNQYNIPENTYELILVSLFYSKTLVPKFQKALKKGGYIMFYLRVVDPQNRKRPDSPDNFEVKPAELKEALKDFQIKAYKEFTDQGIKVVGVLAKKP